MRRMQGYNVLHPIGWDAFGLPAEQYALQTGTHPAVTTERNIARFRQQLQALGAPLRGFRFSLILPFGTHPAIITECNIALFCHQLNALGAPPQCIGPAHLLVMVYEFGCNH